MRAATAQTRPKIEVPWAPALLLLACLLLGGGTTSGLLSDAALQLIAVPFLCMSLWQLTSAWDAPRVLPTIALLISGVIVLIPVLQLVPLPPGIWAALPQRSLEARAFELLQRDLPWRPLSVAPHATALSALSLLPAIAMFLATITLGYRERRILALVLLAVGTVSVFVGLLQVAQGQGSALRFYDVTNTSEAVGFFANRNHFASLVVCLIVIATVCTIEATNSSAFSARALATGRIVALIASFTLLVVLVAAQAMARSRAGLALAIVALVGAVALAAVDRRTTSGVTPLRMFMGAIAVAVMLVVQFTLFRLMDRFATDPLADGRVIFGRLTTAAAGLFMPFGSGLGTFVPVYAAMETPRDALIDTYVNRAHNDFLELGLETGLVGVACALAFMLWFAIACWRAWRLTELAPVDMAMARAATLIVALLAVHSFLDYPLRTSAMMCVLAFACGLLVRPTHARATEDPPARGPGRRAVAASDARAARAPPSKERRAGERWGGGIAWPDEWQSKAGPRRPGSDSKPDPHKR